MSPRRHLARAVTAGRICTVAAILALTGCAETDTRDVVLPDSLLVEVLADLHLADARARLPEEPIGLRDSVLTHHGLDEAVFQRAMDGFLDYPEELASLYNDVLDRLNAERTP